MRKKEGRKNAEKEGRDRMQRKKAEIEGRDKDEFCSDLYIQQGQKSIKCIDIIKIINIVIMDFCVDVTRSEF